MVLERSPGVLYQPVSEGAILLHPEQEVYYGLNPVGAEIWQLLPATFSDLTPVIEELVRRYPDMAVEAIRADVTELVNDLITNGLLEAVTV